MNSSTSYKQYHESMMQGNNGTTIWENIGLIIPVPLLVYFICILEAVGKFTPKSVFIFEFSFVCFIILHLTVLSSFVTITFLASIISFIFFMNFFLIRNNIPSVTWLKNSKEKLFITYFRSIISLMTCICILAVDFHIFPRRFAKTETFGYGLMDTGVGFYIVANAIVFKHNKKKYVSQILRNCLPLILLGFFRFVSIESIDYQKHISEYGVHWNFFFTLAFVKLLGDILINEYPGATLSLSIITAVLHQLMLYIFTESWVLNNTSRSNIFSANKEGLASLLGYTSLYLAGVSMSKIFNKPSDIPNGYFNKILYTFLYACLFLVFTLISEQLFNVSRRLANLSYILWMITMSLIAIGMSMITELASIMSIANDKQLSRPGNVFRIGGAIYVLALPIHDSFQITSHRIESMALPRKDGSSFTPSILQAINKYGLIFFLLSNILTGVVNWTFRTFNLNALTSLGILMLYKLISCVIVYICYLDKIIIVNGEANWLFKKI